MITAVVIAAIFFSAGFLAGAAWNAVMQTRKHLEEEEERDQMRAVTQTKKKVEDEA